MELTSSRPSSDAAPTVSSPTVSTATRSTGGGQCSNCGAHLAPDQRYCVECGRRTNEARPTLMREPGQQLGTAAVVSVVETGPVGVRPTNGTQTLVTIVGVLLLAVGVGVLIGHNGNDNGGASNANASQPLVVAAPAAAAAATTPTDATTPDAAATATDAAATATDKKAAKAAKAAAAAAKKAPAAVAPKAGKQVKVGDKGTGPGYDKKSGEFTGDFFGN